MVVAENDINELRALAKAAVNNNAMAIKTEITNIHDELVNSIDNSKLPEIYFKEYFLDYFKSGVNESNVALDLKWTELAGGMFNEVDITGDDGKVIYSVPPLYAHPSTNGHAIENIDFRNIAIEYGMRSNRLETDGTNYLNKALSGLDKQVVSSDVKEISTRWNNIFKRYDKPASGKETSMVKPHISGMLDDMLEYD